MTSYTIFSPKTVLYMKVCTRLKKFIYAIYTNIKISYLCLYNFIRKMGLSDYISLYTILFSFIEFNQILSNKILSDVIVSENWAHIIASHVI